MIKKTIMVLALCIIMLSCAFAGKFSITGQVSPYSLQTITMESGRHVSTYGFGANVGAGFNICDNLSVGLDFNFDMFKYAEIDDSYLVFGFMAKAGYMFDFSQKVFGQAQIGLGLDIRKIGPNSQAAFGAEFYFGGGYRFSEKFNITAGLDLEHGFLNGSTSSSTDFAAKIALGTVITL